MIDPTRIADLGQFLDDATLRWGSEVALIEASRKREVGRWTFREARQAARPAQRWFADRAVGAGSRVAIVANNQPGWLLSAIAAFWRGATVVPLDVKLPAAEVAALVHHARPELLVVDYGVARALLPRLEAAAAEGHHRPGSVLVLDAPEGKALPALDGAEVVRWDALPADGPVPERVPRGRDDVATLVYSSGTGGTPKGVMLPHRAYLAQYEALQAVFRMEPGHRYFSILPTNHAIDFMVGFLAPMGCGATVVHQRTLRGEFLGWTLQRYGITHMAVVPRLLEALRDRLVERIDERPGWQRGALSLLERANRRLTRRGARPEVSRTLLKPLHDALGGQIEVLFAGGAYVPPELARFFWDKGLPVAIGYGLTEATTVITVNDLKPFRDDTVGRPLPGIDLRIADPDEHGIGEVQVRGPTVMLGYLNEPELTEAAFDGEWLRTGDLGWMDAAFHLHLVGRARNLIVTAGGKNVYPEDLEATFHDVPCEELCVFAANYVWRPEADAAQHAMVAEQLVAVVRAADVPTALRTLRERNLRLKDYQRLSGVVVWDAEFPRTASLKIKRAALAGELREALGRDAIRPLDGPASEAR